MLYFLYKLFRDNRSKTCNKSFLSSMLCCHDHHSPDHLTPLNRRSKYTSPLHSQAEESGAPSTHYKYGWIFFLESPHLMHESWTNQHRRPANAIASNGNLHPRYRQTFKPWLRISNEDISHYHARRLKHKMVQVTFKLLIKRQKKTFKIKYINRLANFNKVTCTIKIFFFRGIGICLYWIFWTMVWVSDYSLDDLFL